MLLEVKISEADKGCSELVKMTEEDWRETPALSTAVCPSEVLFIIWVFGSRKNSKVSNQNIKKWSLKKITTETLNLELSSTYSNLSKFNIYPAVWILIHLFFSRWVVWIKHTNPNSSPKICIVHQKQWSQTYTYEINIFLFNSSFSRHLYFSQ